MLQSLKILLPVLVLSACSTMPKNPSVLVIPGTGKDFTQFRADDESCKQLVRAQFAGAKDQFDSSEDAQQQYDIRYIQCMYTKGHRVPVPGQLMYDSRQDWHPPPPPNLPPPPQTTKP